MANQPEPSPSEIKVAKREIKVWHDDHFRQFRQKDGVSDSFLEDAFDFSDFKPGGGKGGDLMAFTRDNKYICKELNKGDHASLLLVTDSYLDHVMAAEGSLLTTFYMHYLDIGTGRKFVVMKNLLPYHGPYVGRWDLKGCADDKALELDGKKVPSIHKRIFHPHMWCGKCAWSDARKIYYQGKKDAYKMKVSVTAGQHEIITKRIRRDTEWLAANQLMDYSLIVGLRKVTAKDIAQDEDLKASVEAKPEELRQPLIRKDGDDALALYIGIIDFLQLWTCGKKVAMRVKSLECNKATIPPRAYSLRFQKHFDAFLSDDAELAKEETAGLADVKIDISG